MGELVIPASANYQAALASFKSGKISYAIGIRGYQRIFGNFSTFSGGIPGPLVDPLVELDLLSVAFNVPFTISGELSSYALPAGVSLSDVAKIEATCFINHLVGGGTAGWDLDVNGSTFANGGPGFSTGQSATNVVLTPSGSYPTPSSFPLSTVAFLATLGGNIAGTYADQSYAGCALLVTLTSGKQLILLPGAFTVVSGSSFYGTGTVALSAQPVSTTMYIEPWLVSIDDLSQTIQDLDGGADVGNLCFTAQDFGAAITGDFPSFVFEGAEVVLVTGLPGLAGVDFCTLWTGFIDTVASANSNLEYYFSCLDTLSKLNQIVFQKADNGGVTSGQNFRTVHDNPMNILLEILQGEIVNPDQTTGLDPALIDTATIEAYRDGPLAGLKFLFNITQPPNALDFIKNQIMKPLGGYVFCNALGQVTVAFFYPIAGPVTQATLGPHAWTSIPEAEQTDMVNTVEIQFDKDDADVNASGNYDSDVVLEYAPSYQKYGIVGEHVIQADGLRSSFLGYFIAYFVAWMIFYRYGFKNLKFDQNAADSLWSTMRLESGDVVDVTHPQIPDRQAGVMGITNKPFQILDKKWNFTEGRVTLSMIDASYLAKFGFFEIAPNGEADYTAASSSDQDTYMFETANGVYSNGNPGNVLG